MARKEEMEWGDGGTPIFYNVNHSVGRACRNAVDDVLLVQYLLYRIYQHPGRLPVPRGQMKLDGICGPITQDWILTFQKGARKLGYNIFPDGRVEPGEDVKGSHGHQYTIVWMNANLRKHEPVLYPNLADAPDIPARLATALRNES